MKRKIWIAVPAYTGQVHMGTMRTIMSEMIGLEARGHDVTVFDECGNGLIADARAIIVAKFLDEDGTDLIWLDQDVIAPAGTICDMVEAPVDMIGVCYPQRKDPIEFCARWDVSKPELWADRETGFLEVHGLPFGCVRTSRAMLERMCAHYSDLDFVCSAAPNGKACALFSDYWLPPAIEGRPKLKLGEDYAFCARWVDMGGKVWTDPRIPMGHVGYKTFHMSLGDWLRARPSFIDRIAA